MSKQRFEKVEKQNPDVVKAYHAAKEAAKQVVADLDRLAADRIAAIHTPSIVLQDPWIKNNKIAIDKINSILKHLETIEEYWAEGNETSQNIKDQMESITFSLETINENFRPTEEILRSFFRYYDKHKEAVKNSSVSGEYLDRLDVISASIKSRVPNLGAPEFINELGPQEEEFNQKLKTLKDLKNFSPHLNDQSKKIVDTMLVNATLIQNKSHSNDEYTQFHYESNLTDATQQLHIAANLISKLKSTITEDGVLELSNYSTKLEQIQNIEGSLDDLSKYDARFNKIVFTEDDDDYLTLAQKAEKQNTIGRSTTGMGISTLIIVAGLLLGLMAGGPSLAAAIGAGILGGIGVAGFIGAIIWCGVKLSAFYDSIKEANENDPVVQQLRDEPDCDAEFTPNWGDIDEAIGGVEQAKNVASAAATNPVLQINIPDQKNEAENLEDPLYQDPPPSPRSQK